MSSRLRLKDSTTLKGSARNHTRRLHCSFFERLCHCSGRMDTMVLTLTVAMLESGTPALEHKPYCNRDWVPDHLLRMSGQASGEF